MTAPLPLIDDSKCQTLKGRERNGGWGLRSQFRLSRVENMAFFVIVCLPGVRMTTMLD